MSLEFTAGAGSDSPASLAISRSMNLDRRLVRQAFQLPLPLSLTIGFAFLAGICLVLQAYFLSRTIHQVFLGHQALGDVLSLLIGYFGLAILRAALTWGSEAMAQYFAIRIKGSLRKKLMDHLLRLGPGFTRQERTGELVSTITEGIEVLEAYFGQYLPQLALAALVPLSFLAFIFPLDPTTALVLLFTAPLIPFFMILIGSATITLAQRQWTALSHMSAFFLDVIQGLTTLKILGRSRDQIALIAQISDQFRERTMDVLKIAFLSALVLELVATISTAVVAVEVGLRLLYGRLSFDQALFVLLLAPEFYLPLRSLGARFHMGAAGVTAAKRIFEILDTKIAQSKASSYSMSAHPHICFEQVSYQYPQRYAPAVHEISFTLAPGEKVALVGPSGCGKSTVADLLMGFLLPNEGKILVDGHPLEHLDLTAWRTKLSWVAQQPYLFNATVLENIRMACPQASFTEIQRATRLAQAEGFIHRLPQGYETVIGERGQRLSGGEAQRLALARAFLKEAPILILDEATADLDPENEVLIHEALSHLLRRRSVLMIAHRLGTVFNADRILVMGSGKIIEAGTHEQLLARDGLYARMVAAYRGAIAQIDQALPPERHG
jgi:ATP-binding cassette subfamily C protein CydD